MKVLRTNLRKYRVSGGLTQEALANIVGVRRETIYHLENEKYNPSLKMAMGIAEHFKVAVEDIFWYEEKQEEEPESSLASDIIA